MNIKKRLLELFLRHPKTFITMLSSCYALSNEQIEEYKDYLHWNGCDSGKTLSCNFHLDWSQELIDKYIDRWDWSFLTSYIFGEYFWTDDLVEKYKDYINWTCLVSNYNIDFSIEFLEKYKDRINWAELSRLNSRIFTKEIIDKFEDRICFTSLFIGIQNILTSSVRCNTTKNSNSIQPMSKTIIFIEKHEDIINWDKFSFRWNNELSKDESDDIISDFYKIYTKKI